MRQTLICAIAFVPIALTFAGCDSVPFHPKSPPVRFDREALFRPDPASPGAPRPVVMRASTSKNSTITIEGTPTTRRWTNQDGSVEDYTFLAFTPPSLDNVLSITLWTNTVNLRSGDVAGDPAYRRDFQTLDSNSPQEIVGSKVLGFRWYTTESTDVGETLDITQSPEALKTIPLGYIAVRILTHKSETDYYVKQLRLTITYSTP